MIRDNTIIFNIQIALLGVVLVTGFFYLWRMIGRLEDRLESLERAPPGCVPPPGAFFAPADEDIMNQIFGAASVDTQQAPAPQAQPDVVVVEAPEAPEGPDGPDDSVSTTSLSKTKIRKMSVEALREACKDKGLSTEGSRSQLMERLFL